MRRVAQPCDVVYTASRKPCLFHPPSAKHCWRRPAITRGDAMTFQRFLILLIVLLLVALPDIVAASSLSWDPISVANGDFEQDSSP